MEEPGESEQTTTTLIEQRPSSNNKKTFTSRSNTVLTAIEPLSLPSVVGSKALFGNSNNPEHSGGAAKSQGKKVHYYEKYFPKTLMLGASLHGAEVRAKRAKGDLPKIRERIFWSASPRLVIPSNFYVILRGMKPD